MKRLIETIGITLTNIGWLFFHILALILFNPFERKGYYERKNQQELSIPKHIHQNGHHPKRIS